MSLQYKTLSNYILFNDLKLLHWRKIGKTTTLAICEKHSFHEVCTRCATRSDVIYDRRVTTVKDEAIRGKIVLLKIHKRRFFCKSCKKPFTESVEGIWPRSRTTFRFRRAILRACENYSSLKLVQRLFRCSSGYIYKILYEQLQSRLNNKLNYPWPKILGIDEHFFSRKGNKRGFVTVFTDISNKRLREAVLGKDKASLLQNLEGIAGRDNVRWIAMDLADSYKYFAKEYFPSAQIVADKFHVLRLLNPALTVRRKNITGDKRTLPIRKLLLRSGFNLQYYERHALHAWLSDYPELREVYLWKEKLHSFYRIKGRKKAKHVLEKMIYEMKNSFLPEIQKLSRTLFRWRREILNYFYFKLTNAMTEGFNRIASLVKNKAFGYRSFKNYRLRLLNACS